MPQPTRITLPPSGRPVGGLLAAARPLEGEWWRGVTFSSGQCIAPQVVGTCTEEDVTKNPNDLSETSVFDMVGVVQALQCSTLGRPMLDDIASAALDVTREFAVAGELQTGAASGNPSLADASLIGDGSGDVVGALACLDQTAATELSGRLAFIHVAPFIATHLLAEGAVYRDGRTWYTASGNIVVISPGYDGREPGEDVPYPSAGDSLFMYATGEVYAAVGQREQLRAEDRSVNTLHSIAEDAALVAFDPCFNVAIDSGLTACQEVS